MPSPPHGGHAPGRKPIGERLRDRGLITAGLLELALQEQTRAGGLLGEILVRQGLVSPADLARALAEQGGVPYVDLEGLALDAAALALVPEAMARRLKVLPLGRDDRELRLAMANVFDLEAVAEVEAHTLMRVRIAGAAEDALLTRTAQAYGDRRSLDEVLEAAIRAADGGPEADAGDLPIARLVDQLLHKAVLDRATDLHVQPEERTLLTRYRVDGLLAPGPTLPKSLQAPLLARLKVLAEVDVAESRRPQDGGFRLPRDGRTLDVRASFLPARHGEKAVLRFLDKGDLVKGLDQLGMPGPVLARFAALLARPHGLLLVTGPTGSGKTTTLYSALHRLNAAERCIVTVEDPVEYELPMVTQVALNPKAGLTFATGLRGILRQDPDVILVGEIRDGETAGIALRAAMTGHLVLSTLHTADPAGALARLQDLGLPPRELAATVLGIHAQRLVRLICPACAGPCAPEPGTLALAGHPPEGGWRRGAGCEACAGTGIRGRRAIHDLLPFTPAVRDRVAAGAPAAEIEAAARRQDRVGLREQALALAAAGVITLDEAVRVTVADT
jgi:type IV pilus assembly protein PilB